MSDIMGDRGVMEVEALPFWTGPIKIWPLAGGITNRNFGVQDENGVRYAVRLGQDLPHHGVMRFNEQAAARAAAKASISPRIFYTAPGVIVSRLLPGRTLTQEEIRQPENLARIIALIKRCHTGMNATLSGPLLAFWVFHVNRSYVGTLSKSSNLVSKELPRLAELNEELERRAGKVDIVFGHNDLLAANIFDDGARLWLLDWDYAGFNSPLFDLANLSSNNGFYPSDDAALLEQYFEQPVDDATIDSFKAFKCASLLREALWAAVSEESSTIDFDYGAYTQENLARLEVALTDLG
jgi:thiamine kinase-like enzyme